LQPILEGPQPERPTIQLPCDAFGVECRLAITTTSGGPTGATADGTSADTSEALKAFLQIVGAFAAFAFGMALADTLQNNLDLAKKLSKEAQKAKQALDDALGSAHSEAGRKRWNDIWKSLDGAIKRELRGQVGRPVKRTGRGRGF